jgi:nucleotide-binding universal stress UspA family protein
VVPDYDPVSPMLPRTPTDLIQLGTSILDHAVRRVQAMDPEIETQDWLRHGTRTTQLALVSEDADQLVVGRDDRPLLERLLRGDTATGVAARATVPVVQIPAEWQPEHRGTVLVGVEAPRHAGELLKDAFALAQRRDATLVALHAWKLPSGYDDIIESRVDLEEWRREGTIEMEALLRDWRAVYPDVKVEVRVVHDHAGHALVEASRTADLVLIVRRAHGVPAASHLGGTARVVLRASHCPVRIIAPTDAPEMPALVLEDRGEVVK